MLNFMTIPFRCCCLFGLGLFLAACLAGTPSTPAVTQADDAAPVAAPAPVSDDQAIADVLQAESIGVLQQDMDMLASLWLDDSTITDARHTPADLGDDAVWNGIDAIMDRYVVLVFPGNPQVAAPQILSMQIRGDEADVLSSTHIGDEVSFQGDRWRLRKIDGRWYIASLTYNLEPAGR